MPRVSYQYETSPRKYEPEYTPRNTNNKNTVNKNTPKKQIKRTVNIKNKKAQERKNKAKQIFVVMAVFGMLLAVSYREISIMEMFNQKKEMETKLATIEKENGQVEKDIKEVESSLDWNKIQQVATEQLGMQAKAGTPVDLNKNDNVEITYTYIKEEKTSLIEKIVGYIINR